MVHSFNIWLSLFQYMTITLKSAVTHLSFNIIKEGSVGKKKKKRSDVPRWIPAVTTDTTHVNGKNIQ